MKRIDLLGYAEPLSVLAGDHVDFMITDRREARFEAALVRLLSADVGPKGPPFREEAVESPVNGRHDGRLQKTRIGSFGLSDLPLDLRAERSLTLASFVYPTLRDRDAQAVISLLDPVEKRGLALTIGRDGNIVLGLGDGKEIRFLSSGLVAKLRCWTLIAVAVDIDAGRIDFLAHELAAPARRPVERRASVPLPCMPLLCASRPALAASIPGGDAAEPQWLYNGKIDRPRIYAGAVGAEDLVRLANAAMVQPNVKVLAWWDLGSDIGGDRFADLGPHRLDGHLVNLPTRAVTGHNWDGTVFDWRFAGGQYGAVHFHEDDLADALWEPTVGLTLPERLASGVYALKLSRGGRVHSHVPFFVRGSRPTRTKAVLLMPTATYIAYGNHLARLTATRSERVSGQSTVVDEDDLVLLDFPELGRSTYDHHRDGSGVVHATRRRPILNMKPSGRLWNFSLDLCLIDWLDREGIAVEIVTDEDLHREGQTALEGYRLVLTGCHPEYHSTAMLDGLEAFVEAGGRLMYLGGNGFYWRIAHSERHPGVLEVRRGEEGTRLWTSSAGEHHHSFTGELGGTWRRLGRAPNRLAGVGFVAQGFDSAALYRRTAGSRDPRAKFIFDGIEAEFFGHGGLVGDGAAGLEIDSSNQSLGTPEHALVVAQSFGHSNAYVLSLDELEVNLSGADGTVDPRVRAEMVFFEAGKGGAVFSTGSIAYVGALTAHGGDNPLSRLTRNVVTRFLDSTPFVVPMVAADAARSGTPASVVADWAPGSGAGQPQKRKADG